LDLSQEMDEEHDEACRTVTALQFNSYARGCCNLDNTWVLPSSTLVSLYDNLQDLMQVILFTAACSKVEKTLYV
jgi:hypothetical protein